VNSSPLTSVGNPPQFDPCEFYTLSQIIAQGASEVELRTAIGRAYYAMHLIAASRPAVASRVVANGSGGVHQQVIYAIASISGQYSTSQQLYKLKRLRVAADYHMNPHRPYRNWIKNWQDAEVLVAYLMPILTTL
jgi:hypothetical protein